ncbi:class I SAM-dependent DNA methyltransferase [Streptomyces sp. TRM68367]|uniref:type I restriction-modification system subunit M n=1 Tax=Streptomyces sp. TRM68367 TaxID=2758415 RepID=UPI001CA9369B|nr:class I SAM-dependent DNA methyltransferase [Streptomyces sp. TRM68367]
MSSRMNRADVRAELSGVPGSGEIQHVLWTAADKLRGSMDIARYKEFLLGLVFLKYLSDAFDERRAELDEELAEEGMNAAQRAVFLEDKDEYIGYGACWVPESARWHAIAARTGSEDVGRYLDDAIDAVMRENPPLAGVLPKIYGQEDIGWRRLAELVALMDDARLTGPGGRPARDVLSAVYADFLDRFSRAEGKRGGDFHPPGSVARLLVEMLEPYAGRIYDPVCGTAGLLVRAGKFAAGHGSTAHTDDLAVHGQERNERTWRLARMNLALHGVESDLARGDSLSEDRYPGLEADFVLSIPPFNLKEWPRNPEDPRWRFGVPPQANANFAWLQHIIAKLGDKGTAGVVLAGASVTGSRGREDEIRRALIEEDLVACMVALPPNLFHSTGVPVYLWLLDKDKSTRGTKNLEDRRGRILFIDAGTMGETAGRGERTLSDGELAKIVSTYRTWRGTASAGGKRYKDVAGFCFSANVADVRREGHVLSPNRYIAEVGVESAAERIGRLTKELDGLFGLADDLTEAVRAQLRRVDG